MVLYLLGAGCDAVRLPKLRGFRHGVETLTAWFTTKTTGLMGVAVSDGEHVWCSSHGVARRVTEERFWRMHESRIVGKIVLDGDVDTGWLPTGKRSWWRPIACWATFGLIESDGCVGVARVALRRAGYAVPRRVTSPLAVLEWVLATGSEPRAVVLRRGEASCRGAV